MWSNFSNEKISATVYEYVNCTYTRVSLQMVFINRQIALKLEKDNFTYIYFFPNINSRMLIEFETRVSIILTSSVQPI